MSQLSHSTNGQPRTPVNGHLPKPSARAHTERAAKTYVQPGGNGPPPPTSQYSAPRDIHSDHPFSANGNGTEKHCEVVSSRLSAMLAAAEARVAWLSEIGMQAPLKFAWFLSRAHRLSRRHIDRLTSGKLAYYMNGSEPDPSCGGSRVFQADQSRFGLVPSASLSIKLLHLSLYYSWTSCDFILSLSDGSLDHSSLRLVRRMALELRQLLDELESFAPDLRGDDDPSRAG